MNTEDITPAKLTGLTTEIVGELRDGFNATGSYYRAIAPVRKKDRLRSGYNGLVALKIAQWLINSVPNGNMSDSGMFAVALDILAASPAGNDPLAREVHAIIDDYAAGRLDETAFYKRTKKPFKSVAPPETAAAPAHDSLAVTDTERALRASVSTASHGTERAPDAAAAWAAFKSFAARPVHAPPPARVGHDACLFQWGVYGMTGRSLFHWDCVRQWSIDNEDGSYDHMEQLHMTVLYEPQEELSALQRGELWSGEDLTRWFRDVEELDAFRIPLACAVPIEIRISQEEV